MENPAVWNEAARRAVGKYWQILGRMDKMEIKNIIFDVYGTLISTGTGSADAVAVIFSKYDVTDSAEDIYKHWKELHKLHMRQAGGFLTEKDIFVEDLKQLFLEYKINGDAESEVKPMLDSLLHRKLFADVETVMEALLNTHHVAIGSTTDNDPLMENIENTILKKVPQIFTSELLRVYKPDEKFYKEILNRTGWKAEECLFVGDSIEEDILGPQKAGMKTVFINRKGITDWGILSSADFVITSMEELLNVLGAGAHHRTGHSRRAGDAAGRLCGYVGGTGGQN